jgi:LysR family hydrogen peroxide-inducible transcriptional activator
MNIQQLEYIVALDKYKSFSRAAEACFITQATLSTMVKRLEIELELTIFDRKGNPLITTDCGREIINEAQIVLRHSNRIKQLADEQKLNIVGNLKIGIIPTVAGNLLHRILPGILAKYPQLKLFIEEITTKNIINKLRTNEIDVGIISTPLNDDDIEEDILYYEKLLAYGPSVQRTKKYKSPKDISDEKIWLLEEGNCLTDQIIDVCSLNLKKMNTNLSFKPNSFDSLLNIVDEMKGITLIPELYYNDLPEERKRFTKDFIAPYPVREISLVYYRPFAKKRLINAIAEEIKQIVKPQLETSKLKNNEMTIAKI